MSKFICPWPEKINPLSPNGFQLIIDKLPGVVFFSQSGNVPGVSMQESIQATPFVDVSIPAEKLTFEILTVEFLVDESMENYKSVFKWMQGLTFPDNNEQWNQFVDGVSVPQNQPNSSDLLKMHSDAKLIVYGNNNTHIQTISFKDVYPLALSGITFTNSSVDVEYLRATVELKYTSFDFEDLE